MPFEYATRHETRIAKGIVTDALARGWTVSVNDGEETVVSKSVEKAEIFDAMNSTGLDVLIFHDKDGARVGWVQLVWGNDEDLISDFSDNEEMDEFLKRF